MDNSQKLDIPDTEQNRYFLARYFVAHVEDTLQQYRWRDRSTGKIIYDLGQAMIALENGDLLYRTGPNFHDHIMTASDLTPATIDGLPHLVIKYHHVEPEVMHPALVDYFKSSFLEFDPSRVIKGKARTVYQSSPIQTLRWTGKNYRGSNYKVTAYMLKGECFNVPSG